MNDSLTKQQCEALQHRKKDAFGSRRPYKGHFSAASYNKALPDIPDGWVWIHIPSWGIHLRREDDLDYTQDLEN